MPVRTLEPGFAGEPVVACLEEHADAPPELNDVIDLLREVPIKWFIKIRHQLDSLDRLESLYEAFQSAKRRAQVQRAQPNIFRMSRTSGGILGNAIQQRLP